MMKKLVSLLLAMALLLTACTALAANVPTDFFEVSGNVLTVHVPDGYELLWNGTVEPELVAGGETADGFTNYSFTLPEGTAEDEMYMEPLLLYSDEENTLAIGQTFEADEEGNLVSTLIDMVMNELQLEYGVYSDGPALYVQLDTNPSTGYDWTYVPDNSGVFELAYTGYENTAEATDETPEVGTPCAIVFELTINPGLTNGSAMFTYARTGEDPIQTITLDFTLNEDGEILSFQPFVTVAE